jgi:hypothetical protein
VFCLARHLATRLSILYGLPDLEVVLVLLLLEVGFTAGPAGIRVTLRVTVVLQPVVWVTVSVGMTQPVGQVGHAVVIVLVAVLGQQSVLQGTLEVVMTMYSAQ